MKKCPFCGAELNDDCLFCTECGKELPKGNACPHCGAQTNDGDAFCQNCGKKIDYLPNKDNTTNANSNKEAPQFVNEATDSSSNSKKIILPIVIGIMLLALIGGGWYYWNSMKEASLLEMETIFDLYKNNNKEHITQVLKENGYLLYKSNNDSEYWSEFWIKDAQIKEVKDDMDNVSYESIENKGGSIIVYGGGDISFYVYVYSEEEFKKWVEQLQRMGYQEKVYEDNPPEEGGWTMMGANGNLFKQYLDGKGNRVEIMKNNERHSYSVYTIEFAQSEPTPNQSPALGVDSISEYEINDTVEYSYSEPTPNQSPALDVDSVAEY